MKKETKHNQQTKRKAYSKRFTAHKRKVAGSVSSRKPRQAFQSLLRLVGIETVPQMASNRCRARREPARY